MDTQNITFDCRFSKDVDEKFITDYCYVEKVVFNGPMDKARFTKKYLENPFGDSVNVVVYDNDKPIAARSLWRNDIEDKIAYQPVDTCVFKEYRGCGIFRKMTDLALEMIGPDKVIYNFPNQNSLPGYLKMGWKMVAKYRGVIFTSNKKYLQEHPVPMSEEYSDWWYANKERFSYYKKGDCYYLTSPYGKPFIRKIVAQIDKNTAIKYPKMRPCILLYRSQNPKIYSRFLGELHIVSKNDLDYIPSWKIDYV